jgi:hypothetical protein
MLLNNRKTGTNGLTGLGIEPLVGRLKPEAVFFFWYLFFWNKQKKSTGKLKKVGAKPK